MGNFFSTLGTCIIICAVGKLLYTLIRYLLSKRK